VRHECSGCFQPYIGCEFDGFCSSRCYDRECESASDRAYEAFHAGEGPLPLDEQCRQAYEAKEGM
jgi:hypothetical protein